MKTITRKSPQAQQGVSKFGLLMLMILITGFFTVALKLAPLYIDHNLITNICQELIDNGEASNMTVTEVRNRVASSLRINNIRDFELSNIRMGQAATGPVITVAYERRVELVGNLDVIARFDTVLQ